eukprot:5744266-Ditylum_brightwellii.AAC.1
MDTFKTTKPGRARLDHLNQIRLYLGVTRIADICNDNRKMILRGAPNSTTRFRPTIPWPNQEEHLKFSWTTWQRYLRKFFATNIPANTRLDKDWSLDTDLGLWITYKSNILRDAYIETEMDTLYV